MKWEIKEQGAQYIIKEGTANIAMVFSNHTGRAEAKRNAQLVKLAPDMLSIIRELCSTNPTYDTFAKAREILKQLK